jgi:hypothetical protein
MVDEAVYSYHYWAEGLNILIWHDLSFGTEGCSSSGSTEDDLFRLECNAETLDGRQFEWLVHTMDGVTAEMWIDGRSIDLSQGNMFLISTRGGEVEIVQLARDLSGLTAGNASIEAMADNDPDVAAFISQVETPD